MSTDPSRRLSYVLRHAPESIGLSLDESGWVNVNDLLAALASSGLVLSREQLNEAVRTSDKQRFTFDESGVRIRANQGHSVTVNLGLTPVEPPVRLFHGTIADFMPSIIIQGLTRQSRHHVHLSPNVETACQVASRRGTPHILVVDSRRMFAEGFHFFESANGVWLTDVVPPMFISELTS